MVVGVEGGGEKFSDGEILKNTTVGPLHTTTTTLFYSPIQGTYTIQHGYTVFDSIPQPPVESINDLILTNKQTRINKRTSKYTAPPNPQGDRPRSMRLLAINYRILPGSLDNTVRFSYLLLRSGTTLCESIAKIKLSEPRPHSIEFR